MNVNDSVSAIVSRFLKIQVTSVTDEGGFANIPARGLQTNQPAIIMLKTGEVCVVLPTDDCNELEKGKIAVGNYLNEVTFLYGYKFGNNAYDLWLKRAKGKGLCAEIKVYFAYLKCKMQGVSFKPIQECIDKCGNACKKISIDEEIDFRDIYFAYLEKIIHESFGVEIIENGIEISHIKFSNPNTIMILPSKEKRKAVLGIPASMNYDLLVDKKFPDIRTFVTKQNGKYVVITDCSFKELKKIWKKK